MFEANEIHVETPNEAGQRLLSFSNRIFNLDHVAEIEKRVEGKSYSIVFRFANGTEQVFPSDTEVAQSLSWQMLEHCVAKNLYSLKLTEACYMKWAGYRAKEASRPSSQ